MKLTQEDALRAYATMMNTHDVTHIESLLADNFIYESQRVIAPLAESKERFLEYIHAKMQTVERINAPVFAEMGMVHAFGLQPCVILAQNDITNLVGLALAKVEGDKIRRIDLCIVPTVQAAKRSGEYPGAKDLLMGNTGAHMK